MTLGQGHVKVTISWPPPNHTDFVFNVFFYIHIVCKVFEMFRYID